MTTLLSDLIAQLDMQLGGLINAVKHIHKPSTKMS